MESYSVSPIGYIRSPYKQKFAIPRQPRLISEAKARLEFTSDFTSPDAIRGIEDFSHLWLIFRFHETADKGWSPLVRPPRLGGNAKKGVFATRATFRPNGIGMSAVKLEGTGFKNGRLWLELSGIDLLDSTPVLDIKPYLAYSDSLPDATSGFADQAPETSIQVNFTEAAKLFCLTQQSQYPELMLFIEKVLKQDPRPAYKKSRVGHQEYGMSLYDLNIKWQIENQLAMVISIEQNK